MSDAANYGLLARYRRRLAGGGAPAPLADPPFLPDLIGAWHFSEGIVESDGVASWASFVSRSDPGGYVLSAGGTNKAALVSGKPVFSGAGYLQGTIGAFTALTLAVRYSRSSVQQAAQPESRIFEVAGTGPTAIGRLLYQSGYQYPVSYFEDGLGLSIFNAATPPVSGGRALGASGSDPRQLRWIRADGTVSTTSGSGSITALAGGSSSILRVGSQTHPFAGEVSAFAVWDRLCNATDLEAALSWLDALP